MSEKNLKDLVGLKFGRWRVLGRLEPRKAWPKPRWAVQCDCGTLSDVYGAPLVGGRTTSCGCGPVGRPPVHGMEGSTEYRAWSSMWSRCTNPKNASYDRYGARGVSVTPDWENFVEFIKCVGLRPSNKHSLERIDNDGNYEPGNVRWASQKEQANNRSTNRKLVAFGVSRNLSEWSEVTGINPDTLARRIDKWGWTADRALSTVVSRSSIVRGTK